MSENKVIQLPIKGVSLYQLHQELDSYFHQLSILLYKTNELQEKVQEALKIQK